MPSDAVGKELAHFRIERLLGKGGMGAVFLARDQKLGRPVALKVIDPALADDERYRRRLLREARAAAAVSHANIATVYEVGEADGQLYIAMEYVAGRSLADALDDGPLGLSEALTIAAEIALALEKAHATGVVHRDLKPDNTMLVQGGGVKVLDFGIARLARQTDEAGARGNDDGEVLTREGTVMGTPGYMSPEQALGLELDHRTDIFALGVLLYEMVSGHRPFADRTPLEAAVSVTRDEPLPLGKRHAGTPQAVEQLVHRCLAKDPADRYPSVTELREALAELADGERPGSLATAPTVAAPKLPSKRSGGPPVSTAGQRPAGRPGRRWWVVAAVALGVVVMAWLALRDGTLTVAAGPGSAAPAPSSPAPTAVPITALPDPQSSAPAALAAYREALQAFRDANWPQAAAALERALTHDPGMAAAHLQFTVIHVFRDDAPAARTYFRKAGTGRAALSDRDLALFEALEPLAAREPADLKEAIRRMAAAAAAHPNDAELAMLHAALLQRAGMNDASLAPAQRSVELDPKYADGWQMVGLAHAAAGRMEDLALALDRCVEAAPTTVDCLFDRIKLRSARGECQAVIADAKLAMARSLRSGWGHRFLAMGLASQGEPVDHVAKILVEAAPHYPDWGRKQRTLDDQTYLALLAGKFDEAEGAIKTRGADQRDDATMQWSVARRLVALYDETSRPERAAETAREFFASQHLWGTPPSGHAIWDPTPLMLRTLLAAGDIDSDQYEQRRSAWIAEWQRKGTGHAGEIWLSAWGFTARTAAEATQAIAQRPADFEPIRLFRLGNFSNHVGQLYFLAGDLDGARRYLEEGVGQCRMLFDPGTHFRACDALGQVYEAGNEPAKACASYAAVLTRWSHTTPRSVTAAHAHARHRALGCPAITR